MLFWFNVKESYTPMLTAELEVSHKCRNQLRISFGYSTTDDTTISLPYWYEIFPNDYLAFDGTTDEDKYASLVIDLTNLYTLKMDNPDGNWYLRIEDSIADGIPGKIKSFKLVDKTRGIQIPSSITSVTSFDGSKIEVPIIIFVKQQQMHRGPYLNLSHTEGKTQLMLISTAYFMLLEVWRKEGRV